MDFPKMGCLLQPQENVLMNVKNILYILKGKFIKYTDLYNESSKVTLKDDLKWWQWDFPSSPGVKTLRFHSSCSSISEKQTTWSQSGQKT